MDLSLPLVIPATASSETLDGLALSALSGFATALAVGIALLLCVHHNGRTAADLAKYGLAAVAVVSLFGFAAYDTRHAALAYLGINPSRPYVAFEIRLPGTLRTIGDLQVELRTDHNERLAELKEISRVADGRGMLAGVVPLDYRTANRLLILALPDGSRCEFKLRLPPMPHRTDGFGPWHLADRAAAALSSRAPQREAFSVRYRVL